MSEIILIAAIGSLGQLGLKGNLPWGSRFAEDRKRFKEVTKKGVVLVGYNTWPTVEHLQGTEGRTFIKDDTRLSTKSFMDGYYAMFGSRTLFIAGGAKTYKRWMPFVDRLDISILDYSGEADVYFPSFDYLELIGGENV